MTEKPAENTTAETDAYLGRLTEKYPVLNACRQDIGNAFVLLADTFSRGGKVLVCGNGGSAADSNHIVGELMKGFRKTRSLPEALQERILAKDPALGEKLAGQLQNPLPAISLTEQSSLSSAFANDVDPSLGFAQQVLGYGREGDCLIGISTSGNARNVVFAVYLASVLGLKTVGMTGVQGGTLASLCDVCIQVPESDTAAVQELHLPVYHTICSMLEEYFFPG